MAVTCVKVFAVCLLATGCRYDSPKPASVLLFNGRGTSAGDVAAVENILGDTHLSYATANSRQLDAMTAAQLGTYRLLIVPGGNFVQIGNSLTPVVVANVRDAVQGGLNYLGICAGAFFAGNSPYNGLNLTSGVRFPFYAAEARGIRKAAVQIAICWFVAARAILGRRAATHWLGRCRRQVWRWHSGRRARKVRQRMGDAAGNTSRSAGHLAPRTPLQRFGHSGESLRGDADHGRAHCDAAEPLLALELHVADLDGGT
jgi:hypothetical protein